MVKSRCATDENFKMFKSESVVLVAVIHSLIYWWIMHLILEVVSTCNWYGIQGKQIIRGVLPMIAHMGGLRPKGLPFSGFRYIKR